MSIANDLGITPAEKSRILAELAGAETEPDNSAFTDDGSIEQASYDKGQVIELCRTDLNFLAAVAMPEQFKYLFPPVYIAIWQFMLRNTVVEKTFPQLALGIPRGHAKTTLIKLYILYCVLFTEKKFILVVSATLALAEEILSDVCDMLDQPNIKAVFGDWRLGQERDTTNLKKFGFRKRNIILVAIGSEGSLRGMNIKNARPDVMIFEDIQTRECADSKLQSDNLEKWMIGTAMKAKSPEGCMFLFVGNMYPTPNSILKKLKTNSSWTKFISGAILADGTALWEELRSLNSLLEELENDIGMGHPEIFFSEVLNDTEAGANSSVDFSRFKAWPWGKDEHPQGRFIIIDPSIGKGQDQDAIGLFEVYDETIGFRSVVLDCFSPKNLIKRALLVALSTNTRFIAIEAMGYQFTLLHWFEEVCKDLGITGIMCLPIYANAHSKNSRIASGIRTLEAGQLVLHPDVRSKVQNQIANWNALKRDNQDELLDLVAYAPKVVADYTYQILTDFSTLALESAGAAVVDNNSCF